MKDKLKTNWLIAKIGLPIAFLLLLILASCEPKKQESQEGHSHLQEDVYYCPMDTEVVSNKPGVCPKCGMDLVKKEIQKDTIYYCPMDTEVVSNRPGVCPKCGMDLVVKEAAEPVNVYEVVTKTANATVLSSVMTVRPTVKSFPVTINAFGYVGYDTRRINTISSRVDEGRVEKLYVKYPFQSVKKGQPLLELFSHELLSAQKEYFNLKETDPEALGLIASAREKLVLLGMTESQINNLRHDGQVHPTTTIYSPYTGYVVENIPEDVSSNSTTASTGMQGMATTSTKNSASMSANQREELILREGAYLNRGSVIFKVVNTEVVWGIFEIYSDQLPFIKLNQTVTIKVENRDESITGKVDFIEPNYQGGSKTSRFRVYLNNKNGQLKIGSLLKGELVTDTKQTLWIPVNSVYDLGIDKIVFVKKGEVFEAHKITTGIRANNLVGVVKGLDETDEVAANAQYMVDSESFIKVNNE